MAPSSAADPRAETDGKVGALADAAARLESALARLEALVDTGPLQSEMFRDRDVGEDGDRGPSGETDGLRAELKAVRARERTLGAAAAAASAALGGP